jgi:hypothetical protein
MDTTHGNQTLGGTVSMTGAGTLPQDTNAAAETGIGTLTAVRALAAGVWVRRENPLWRAGGVSPLRREQASGGRQPPEEGTLASGGRQPPEGPRSGNPLWRAGGVSPLREPAPGTRSGERGASAP